MVGIALTRGKRAAVVVELHPIVDSQLRVFLGVARDDVPLVAPHVLERLKRRLLYLLLVIVGGAKPFARSQAREY